MNTIARRVWSNPIYIAAFGFGAGLSKWAPGTFGTLVAIPIYLLLQDLPAIVFVACVVVLAAVGIWLCHVTARDLGVHDHPGIVWDEIVGYLVTMVWAPSGWFWVVLGFGLFRFFDIVKPWPIRVFDERVGGGLGIMLDDIVAGVFAMLCLQVTALWLG